MERVLEPELMDDLEQARAYAEADFAEPNGHFVELFDKCFPQWEARGPILDLGCGPGDISLRMAQRFAACEIHGVDGSAAMLQFAEQARCGHQAAERVRFIAGMVPGAELPYDRYQAVVSNSLLHHLHQPVGLWQTIFDRAAPGAPVLVMDLMRASTPAHAQALVDDYAEGEPDVLRQDFYHSLLAAFEIDEVRAQLDAAGLAEFRVEPVSDRHLAVWGRMRG